MSDPDPDIAERDVVTFQLGGEVLAVAARHLREVLEPVPVTRVPGAPDFVSGLINVRGAVVPLSDLRVPLRMPRAAAGPDARILVLELPLAGEESVVGVLADGVHEVTRIPAGALEEIPSVGTRWPPRFVAAIGRWGGQFVTLPDLPAIFADLLAGPASDRPPSGAAGAAPQTEPETTR